MNFSPAASFINFPEDALMTCHWPAVPPVALISVPHTGLIIPTPFEEYLVKDRWALDQDVDFQVDQLLDLTALHAQGIVVIKTQIHRACIDLNRPADHCLLHWQYNTHGQLLVEKKMDPQKARQLVKQYHDPYYSFLSDFIKYHSPRWIIDLHSMPSTTTDFHLQKNSGQNTQRPDFCISDFHGKSCSAAFLQKILAFFQQTGHVAKQNDPYFGGHITQFLAPLPVENVQIEVNRNLYMNEGERLLRPIAMANLAAQLNSLLQSL